MPQYFSVDEQQRQKLSEAKVERAFEVIPSDADELSHPTIALYVGNEGDIKIKLISGDVITLTNLVAGAWHPIAAVQVFNTDTTCDGIVGAW